jgi:hypothetical protein
MMSHLSSVKAVVGLGIIHLMIWPGCSGSPKSQTALPDTQMLRGAQSRLYPIEGERSSPSSCESLDDDDRLGLLTRYFAHTQGSKAIVKEHCESEDLPVLPDLERGSCQTKNCWSHDTYRRGPTYFARFLAALEASLPSAQVEVQVLGSEVMTEGHAQANRGKSGTHTHQFGGLFELAQHRVVHKQRIKFHLDEHTRCVAQFKTFRDMVAKERTDRARTVKNIDLSPKLGLGDIWAEHRRTTDGYEVMILERQLAQGRGEGEVLEVEMLCINPHAPINPHHQFDFTAREINRDTLRIFAYPK